jgi:tRNA1(Val) A37 N6-methylase TrmN6
MNDYSQPSFYHFSEDSLSLVEFILKKVERAKNILDFGAGCGVIAFELNDHMNFELITMIEPQEDFYPYIKKNASYKNINDYELIDNLKDLKQDFDLIVSNPPYFIEEDSRKSLDEKKNRCRQWSQACAMEFASFLKSKKTSADIFIIAAKTGTGRFLEEAFEVFDISSEVAIYFSTVNKA